MQIAQIQDFSATDAETPAYRQQPRNEDAEQALLGALLVNNISFEKVCELIKPGHFYNPVHARIYEAIATVIERGQEASPVTLRNYFEKDEDLAHVGGASYLAELAASVITVVNIDDYARAVYETHLRRALIALGEDITNEAFDHKLDISPRRQIEEAEKRLYDLATTGDFKSGFQSLKDSVQKAILIAEKAFKTSGHVTGVTTGLTDLNRQLGGLQNSDLIILAGRPSMGKTALATNIAVSAARAYAQSGGKEGAIVGLFSLEMAADQLATRILADLSEIPSDKIRRGEIRDTDFRRFVEASHELSGVPLFIDDTAALSIGALRTRARRLQRQHGLGLVVVDYLQLLSGSRNAENRVLEVSEITRGLKAIAKELQIPVVALSQLSRAVEQRDDKRPMLSDLRESGAIEQDADVVMFVFREEYYVERTKPSEGTAEFAEWQQKMMSVSGKAEVIIGKQRHGPVGTVELSFESQFTRFGNLARDYQQLPHR